VHVLGGGCGGALGLLGGLQGLGGFVELLGRGCGILKWGVPRKGQKENWWRVNLGRRMMRSQRRPGCQAL